MNSSLLDIAVCFNKNVKNFVRLVSDFAVLKEHCLDTKTRQRESHLLLAWDSCGSCFRRSLLPPYSDGSHQAIIWLTNTERRVGEKRVVTGWNSSFFHYIFLVKRLFKCFKLHFRLQS